MIPVISSLTMFSINLHIKMHIYTPSVNEKDSYFTSFGLSRFLLTCGAEMRRTVTRVISAHVERIGERVQSYLLLQFLQFFVLHVLELGSYRSHFFLQLRTAQLIHVQHEWELHILLVQTHNRDRLRHQHTPLTTSEFC